MGRSLGKADAANYSSLATAIRLNASETNSREGRTVKTTEDVYPLLTALMEGKKPDQFCIYSCRWSAGA